MAAAAVELGEYHQRQKGVRVTLIRWLPAIMIVVFGFIAIPTAIDGDDLIGIAYVLIVLGSIGNLLFNPAMRPRSLARSLEASRKVDAAS